MTFEDFVNAITKADVILADDDYIYTKTMLVTPVSVLVTALSWDTKDEDCIAYEFEIAKEGFEKDSIPTAKNGIEVYDQNSNQTIKFLFFHVKPMVLEESVETAF